MSLVEVDFLIKTDPVRGRPQPRRAVDNAGP